MSDVNTSAFGRPGIEPRWTSSAKDGVGTSISMASRVWFTFSHGIFNEIYYPRIDQACTRDVGMIVTDGKNFFSEEKRHTETRTRYIEPAIPAFRVTNTCTHGMYRIEKEILSDPDRDTVLQHTKFVPLAQSDGDYRLHVLLSSHLGNRGAGNTAWLGDYKGTPMLFAARDSDALALACSAPWKSRSVGFVGFSDGWQDLNQHKMMTWRFERAEDGNVALVAEIDWQAAGPEGFVLSIGFGVNASEAGHRALASLLENFQDIKKRYVHQWGGYHKLLKEGKTDGLRPRDLHKISASVLRIHEAKRFPGGIIASLSIPWGMSKGDDDLGGYHLVWPRDLAENAGGLLATGAHSDARRVLQYLMVTQEADGHWSQNMWLDGYPYWTGSQMDETAFPILLADLARRQEAIDDEYFRHLWPTFRKAAQYIVCNGPITQQDRWEEDPGYSPFSLAVEIAALLAAADMADLNGEQKIATYLRQTADVWNASVERWTYVRNTDLTRSLGVDGYYVRISPPETSDGSSPLFGFVPIKNRPPGESGEDAAHIISPDALALVRFGLRAADDARIVNTVKVIDALLKVETPSGPVWHRYNDDGYGEHEDGGSFDGSGIGRGWPLLTGERGHYELAAGRPEEAKRLLAAMENLAGGSGLIPEQVWDSDDIPEKELFLGRPSGSAMPLVWAHAEYLKLHRSITDNRVFDLPRQTVQRYIVDKVKSNIAIWRFNHKCRTIPKGKTLRIEILEPALIHWSNDGWTTTHDTATDDTGIGIQIADLPTGKLEPGREVVFTFYWQRLDTWERKDYSILVSDT